MTLFIEYPKVSPQKNLLELIKNSVAVRYKINIQKLVTFLYTNNELSERKIKETIPFIITLKRIKYIGINLTKEVKYLYSENHKILMKEVENDTKKWKDIPCS